MLHLKDRYSFWYKLLTLMLNGIHDEVPEIRKLCVEKFHAGGRQWEQENEEEIKDLVDFGLPEDSDRPPLGCRILVEREFSKILPGLMKDIGDWTVEIRLQSAGLLKTLLEYCEAKYVLLLFAPGDFCWCLSTFQYLRTLPRLLFPGRGGWLGALIFCPFAHSLCVRSLAAA